MSKQLEQKHLEESIVDAKTAVRYGFEKMIIDKVKNLKGIDDLTRYTKTSDTFSEKKRNIGSVYILRATTEKFKPSWS
jgi:hypothetical protein